MCVIFQGKTQNLMLDFTEEYVGGDGVEPPCRQQRKVRFRGTSCVHEYLMHGVGFSPALRSFRRPIPSRLLLLLLGRSVLLLQWTSFPLLTLLISLEGSLIHTCVSMCTAIDHGSGLGLFRSYSGIFCPAPRSSPLLRSVDFRNYFSRSRSAPPRVNRREN